jgi:predicted DNA-binding helix-hairpin-helix protein
MMRIQSVPDTLTKITEMGDVTLYEPAGDQPQHEKKDGRYQARGLADCISNVSTPTGKKPILKTMITTACEKDCFYCPFRAGRGKTKRVTITPDALASAFDQMQRARQVDGLFLSSGIIKGSIRTQDKIIDTIEIIRKRYEYRGYVHLKIMPGAEYDQLYRAMQLADRVSVNLEAPTQERLSVLAPKKDFEQELLKMLQLASKIKREHPHEKLANTVTQFVVGAVGDTDLELLSVSERLYRQMGIVRAYYSAFHPVAHTPLENVNAVAPIREFRLYQASFLLRDYKWEVEDLPFIDSGNLRTDIDPKRAWAEVHLRYNPIEIMTATREQLMRIPNIGPKGADAIIAARRKGSINDISYLRKLGIHSPEKAAPYLLLDGHKPPTQMSLF